MRAPPPPGMEAAAEEARLGAAGTPIAVGAALTDALVGSEGVPV